MAEAKPVSDVHDTKHATDSGGASAIPVAPPRALEDSTHAAEAVGSSERKSESDTIEAKRVGQSKPSTPEAHENLASAKDSLAEARDELAEAKVELGRGLAAPNATPSGGPSSAAAASPAGVDQATTSPAEKVSEAERRISAAAATTEAFEGKLSMAEASGKRVDDTKQLGEKAAQEAEAARVAAVRARHAATPSIAAIPPGTTVASMRAGAEPSNNYPNIHIAGSPEFRAGVERDIERLEGTESGRGLLNSIQNNPAGKRVTIVEDQGLRPKDDGTIKAADQSKGSNQIDTDSRKVGWAYSEGWVGARMKGDLSHPSTLTKGTPADATVAYDPKSEGIGAADPNRRWYEGTQPWQRTNTPDVTLFHELTHALDVVSGTLPPASSGGGAVPIHEQTAVGLTRHPANPFSENRYREEKGVPTRDRYYGYQRDHE